MSDRAECWCGEAIREIKGVWVGANDSILCYPDADNENDASAEHEPADTYDEVDSE